MPTVGEMKADMGARVRVEAERVGIEVNSITMWPICAMDPFLEACGRLAPLEHCQCDAFNEAVNEEVIFWDTDICDESRAAGWCMNMNGQIVQYNFCPFCGKLTPLSPHSNDFTAGGGEKHG